MWWKKCVCVCVCVLWGRSTESGVCVLCVPFISSGTTTKMSSCWCWSSRCWVASAHPLTLGAAHSACGSKHLLNALWRRWWYLFFCLLLASECLCYYYCSWGWLLLIAFLDRPPPSHHHTLPREESMQCTRMRLHFTWKITDHKNQKQTEKQQIPHLYSSSTSLCHLKYTWPSTRPLVFLHKVQTLLLKSLGFLYSYLILRYSYTKNKGFYWRVWAFCTPT